MHVAFLNKIAKTSLKGSWCRSIL